MGFVIDALRQALDQPADTDPAVRGDPAAMVELPSRPAGWAL
jgi:hypothetical protein